jgi:cation diffusion facilitator family transporter
MTPKGITWVSVWVNVVLSGVKMVVAVFCNSQTLLADGLHSGSDLFTDVAVLAGLRVSSRPADPTHHYGHRRIATLVGLFIGLVLAGAAVWIVAESLIVFHDYIHKHGAVALEAGLPFWVALASAAPKEVMFRLTRRVGHRVRDVSVMANAWHHRTDAFAALAAAAGLGGVLLGGADWRFLDPLTATVLAAFLIVASARIMSSSASELIDRSPGGKVLTVVEQAIARTEGVKTHHAFRARQVGGKVEMDVHVQVDPGLTVRQGHDIASAVRDEVQRADPHVVEVIVHVEPAEGPPR